MFYKRLLIVASLLGAIGVMFGAFGAHYLKSRLPANELEIIKTGVLYLFIHILATLWVYSISSHHPGSRWLRSAGITFVTGVILFSGSLFIIGTKTITGIPASSIGFVTPLGGLSFIAGWIFLSCYALKT